VSFWTQEIRVKPYWRIYVMALLGIIASTVVWRGLFPDVFHFEVLWGAVATGSFAGFVLGCAWQLLPKNRRPRPPGKVLVAVGLIWGTAALVSLAVIVPDYRVMQEELRRLRATGEHTVHEVAFRFADGRTFVFRDAQSLSSFAAILPNARFVARSHELFAEELEITIEWDGNVRHFKAGVPENHRRDVDLELVVPSSVQHVCVPDLMLWFGKHRARTLKGD
jgi:hypothetical protein